MSVVVGTGSILVLLARSTSHIAFTAAGEELDVFPNHAQLGAFLPGGFIFPGIQLKASFHKDSAALAEVVAGNFRLAVPKGDVHESGFFLAFAVVARVVTVDGKADVRNGGSFGSVAQFGISGKVAH